MLLGPCPKKETQKEKLKIDFVKYRLRIPKMYPACLSDVCEDGNNFLKFARAQLKPHIWGLFHETNFLKQSFKSSIRNVFKKQIFNQILE